MSKFNDQTVLAAFQPYLQSEEVLVNAAYCIYQPPQLLGCLLSLIGWLPGLLYFALLSRFYVVGLTNHNFIVLRLASRFGGNIQVAEIFGYRLDQLPETQATFGSFGTSALKIKDPTKPLKVGFPSVGVPDNHQRGRMIANALLSHWQQRQLPTSEQTPQSQAIPGAAPLFRSVPAGSAPIAESVPFNLQTRPATYVPQSSHKTFGCLGAAMITVGAGIFLFCALGFLGFLLDESKTSQNVTAGLIGFSVLLLFSATVLAIGIYLVVHGRKEKAAAVSLQRTHVSNSRQSSSQKSSHQPSLHKLH
jgi:hypothetical protein